MPELPEVETIRLQLNQALKGLKIVGVEVLSPKNFIGDPGEVVGEKVEGVERRAKIILVKISGGKCLAVHLKLTGRLLVRKKGDPPDDWQRVVIKLKNTSDGGRVERSGTSDSSEVNYLELRFADLRKFGWIRLITNNELRIMNNELGIEPFDKEFTVEYLHQVFSKTSRAIKQVLLDQKKIAGVGNIYANEALFLAGIRPTRPANSLTEKEIKKLRNKVIKVLKEAILHKGTSDKDEAYRQISGEKGKHQNYLQVYGRGRERCPKCSGEIERVKLGGRGTFYCPKCQK